MRVKNKIRQNRIKSIQKLYSDINKILEKTEIEVFKVIKNDELNKYQKEQDILNLFFDYIEEILSLILTYLKNNLSNNYETSIQIEDINEIFYQDDGNNLRQRIHNWVNILYEKQFEQLLFYHICLIFNTETYHFVPQILKKKLNSERTFGEIIGDAEDEICSEYIDGNVYLLDDLPDPPFHPNCECMIIPYDIDELEEDIDADEINSEKNEQI